MRKSLGIVAAVIFLSLFLIYGGFEIAKVIIGPSLTIIAPKNFITVDDPLIAVNGTVMRASYITINDRQIFADTNGNFSDTLLVPAGYSIIKIEVKDRFGKIVTKNIMLEYIPKESEKKVNIATTEQSATSTEASMTNN